MAEDRVVVSLREIAEKFGIGIEGARAKAKRRAAKGAWRILPQNHPADPLRVEVPIEELEAAKGSLPEGPPSPNVSPQTPASQQEDQHKDTHDIKALVSLLEKLTEQSSHTTERLVQAERGRGEAEQRAVLAEARLASAEAAQKAAQEASEARLDRIRAELEEIARRQGAAAAEAQAELAAWRARPWWKRVVG